jgi:hypothetical protein
VNAALREAGGGRMAGVRIAYEFGKRVYVVQFVRGTWLCAATVDAATGAVLSILGEGLPVAQADTSGEVPVVVTARLGFHPVGDVQPAVEDPAAAYVATEAGVGVVRLFRDIGWTLVVEDHHPTGFAPTRRLAAVPGGVLATTADGQVFRMDTAGRLQWHSRLPCRAHSITADSTGMRVLVATDGGAVELDARTGRCLGLFDGPARAAAYLPDGGRIVAGPRGDLRVTTAEGATRWRMEQGEFPERLWVQHERIFVAGTGGLKEIAVGEGVVARWSVPAAETVDHGVVINGSVFTVSGGSRLDRHGYATAGYHGRLARFVEPAAITVIEAGRRPWLLVGHQDGRLSAQPV